MKLRTQYEKDSLEDWLNTLAGWRLAHDRALEACDYDKANIKAAQIDSMEKQITTRLMRDNRMSYQQAKEWLSK